MFKLAVEEESLFPARCCNEAIPVDDHLDILSPELVERYRARDEEHRSTNRVYCHVPTCSTFCSGKAIREHIATCPKCGRKTCVKCKAAQHESKECPENESDKKVEVLGKREGWQHCIKCNHLVEKEYGCDHMTCACGAEFCYRCGTAWPCDCDSVPEIVPRPAVMLGTLPVGGGGPNRPETLPLGENGASMPHEHEQDHHWLRGDAPAACWLCWAQVHLIYQCDTCFMMICDACWQGRQGGF
ncbi:hypothetical protein CDD83_8521 [Cordyceps sp. RAO-2017]|nr:hypothetical protein CDD83_8521 [Cordyceps sp. RAO-2017]